jgi:hypothetical protein
MPKPPKLKRQPFPPPEFDDDVVGPRLEDSDVPPPWRVATKPKPVQPPVDLDDTDLPATPSWVEVPTLEDPPDPNAPRYDPMAELPVYLQNKIKDGGFTPTCPWCKQDVPLDVFVRVRLPSFHELVVKEARWSRRRRRRMNKNKSST